MKTDGTNHPVEGSVFLFSRKGEPYRLPLSALSRVSFRPPSIRFVRQSPEVLLIQNHDGALTLLHDGTHAVGAVRFGQCRVEHIVEAVEATFQIRLLNEENPLFYEI